MTTTVITGSNRGIGLDLCRQTAARGDRVIALCRRTSPQLDALKIQVEDGIDVARDDVGAELAARLNGTDVDLLINCAGILSRQSLDNLDYARMREQFEINSLGPLRVTAALLPNLGPGAKVAIVTSRMGSMTDNTSGSHYGYRMSKAAVNITGVSLAQDLKQREIAVILLHPGYVSTEMTNHSGDVAPADAARGLLARIEDLSLANSGAFYHMNGEPLPW